MAAPLSISAPNLQNYEDLEMQFEWLCGGSIVSLVEKNLSIELKHLERYLESLGREDILVIMQEFKSGCEEQFDNSGSTYRWVGILRAAEELWKTGEDYCLFRSEMEGISGSSPHIVFSTRNR